MNTRAFVRAATNTNRLKQTHPQPLRRRHHSPTGVSIAELAASLLILLPIVISTAFVAIESAQAFMINAALNHCASLAARQLAIAYGSNPSSTKANPNCVFDNIRFMNIVVSSQQFEVPSQGGWNESGKPPSVTVLVTFRSGTYGCPSFPDPDLLGLGSNFTMTARATCRLE